MDVNEQEQLTHQQAIEHWYYRAQFDFLTNFIKSLPLDRNELRLADFGCGLGLYLSLLEKDKVLKPDQMCGIDTAYNKNTTIREGETSIYPHFQQNDYFDVILLMHTLEHIADDAEALKMVSSYCKLHGYLFITVPAFQFLWSQHDVILGHHRRYTRNSLIQLIKKDQSLRLLNAHYYYASILPVVILARWIKRLWNQASGSDLKPIHKYLNYMLLAILNFESKLAHYNRVAGLSVVAVCQKQIKL